MEAVGSWIAKKGLSVAADTLVKELRARDLETKLERDLREINSMLEVLIHAPFKEAVLHLREGNLSLCKNKLIQAIAQDELNVPARLLYIDFLRYERKYSLALDYYWNILESFRLPSGLLPSILVELHASHTREGVLPIGGFDLDYFSECDGQTWGWYPNEFWASSGGIVVLWERMYNGSFEALSDRFFDMLTRKCTIR